MVFVVMNTLAKSILEIAATDGIFSPYWAQLRLKNVNLKEVEEAISTLISEGRLRKCTRNVVGDTNTANYYEITFTGRHALID